MRADPKPKSGGLSRRAGPPRAKSPVKAAPPSARLKPCPDTRPRNPRGNQDFELNPRCPAEDMGKDQPYGGLRGRGLEFRHLGLTPKCQLTTALARLRERGDRAAVGEGIADPALEQYPSRPIGFLLPCCHL